MPSYAPIYDPNAKAYEKVSVPELTKAYVSSPFFLAFYEFLASLFDRKHLYVACDPRFG